MHMSMTPVPATIHLPLEGPAPEVTTIAPLDEDPDRSALTHTQLRCIRALVVFVHIALAHVW